MKLRTLLFTAVMAMTATQASAEVELLFHMLNGEYVTYTVIERSKKLFILDDDDNTQFIIKNYKKSGNIETFTIVNNDTGLGRPDSANITITLDSNGHTCKIQYKNATYFDGGTYDVKTVTTPVEEHNRMMRYFNELTGNPVDQGLISNGSLNSRSRWLRIFRQHHRQGERRCQECRQQGQRSVQEEEIGHPLPSVNLKMLI